MGITESHLNNTFENNSLQIDGFRIERKERENKKGGGLLIFINNRFLCNRRMDLEDKDLEIMWLKIKTSIHSPKIMISFVYRLPSTDMEFDIKLIDNINRAALENRETWILGDMNIDLFKKQNLAHRFYENMLTLGF